MIEIYGMIRRERVDCVYSLFESSDLIAAIVAPLAGVRALISGRRDTGFRYSPTMNRVYRLINRRFRRFVAPSEAVRASLLDQGVTGSRVDVIYNGVDFERFARADGKGVRAELGIPDDALMLTTVANLSPVKDHANVIAALAALHAEGLRPYLALAGDGPLRSDLEARVAAAGLEPYVCFMGRRQDVPDVLATSDLVICSSLTEGLPNALLEAGAAGKAVVATNVGGNPEVVEDGVTGLLVPPRDPAALADAVRALAASPERRERMGRAARARVRRNFSLEAMVRQYMDVFASVAGPAPEDREPVEGDPLRVAT